MTDVEESSGNVYADLGVKNPDEMLVRAQLASKIGEVIRVRKLKQADAAAVVGLTQPRLSALLSGKFRGISEAKLIECLRLLGRDVQIVVGPARKRLEPGRIDVVMTP